jgi:hypothetical protein
MSLQLKTYQAGERLVDRMDFEELALKGIDPSLGPPVHPDLSGKSEAENIRHPTTTVIYSSLLSDLGAYLAADSSHIPPIYQLRSINSGRASRAGCIPNAPASQGFSRLDVVRACHCAIHGYPFVIFLPFRALPFILKHSRSP